MTLLETFKELYNDTFLQEFSARMQRYATDFREQEFYDHVHAAGWEQLAFKQRIRRISEALTAALSLPYEQVIPILLEVAPECTGVQYLFLPDYVELNGLDHHELSMHALEQLTCYSSAEFAVRPFILQDPERMLEQMNRWADHENEHIRRLASEGFRPRLPWSFQLKMFIIDPEPTLRILDKLKQDPSLYVRKSVANHLNDIAKDHPDRIAAIAREWYGKHPHTDWIVRHGCRTLLKQDHPEVMDLFGYLPNEQVRAADFAVSVTEVAIGDDIELSFTLFNEAVSAQNLRIDYEVDLMKANGRHAAKRFRWVSREFAPGQHLMRKKHSFKLITTRVYYPGVHHIRLYVNGEKQGDVSFILTTPGS